MYKIFYNNDIITCLDKLSLVDTLSKMGLKLTGKKYNILYMKHYYTTDNYLKNI